MEDLIITHIKTLAGTVCLCGPTEFVKSSYGQIKNFNYERRSLDGIKNLKFDKFLDVGAAFGYFSHYISHYFPEVEIIAFEAEPFRYACLNYTTGNFKKIHGVVGPVEVELGKGQHQMKFSKRATSLQNIDLGDFLDGSKTLIKLDVEGCEKYILESLHESSRLSFCNFWLIEIHPNHTNVSEEDIQKLLPLHDMKQLSCGGKGISTCLFSPVDKKL